MVSEFETKLAAVLSGRMPTPWQGRVQVAPGSGNRPRAVLGVTRTERIERDLGSRRPELAPGAENRRRVVRLRCTVTIQFLPSNVGRPEEVRGVDGALYVLDAADIRDGSALGATGDPGFFIEELAVVEALAPLDPNAVGTLTLAASGWFWPVAMPGEAGVEIGEIRVRGAILPVSIVPSVPRLTAGAPAADLTLLVGTTGDTFRVTGDGDLPDLPFGALALAVRDAEGAPGAGTLSGGTAGSGAVRLVQLVEGKAAFKYTPPAAAAEDELIVALDDGEGGQGVEIGRFPLTVHEG